MSYKLIDANDLALLVPEITMPCIFADLPNGLDGKHYTLETSHKGHWIDALYSRKCSECGYDMCKKDEWGQFIPDKACPNCGAKMESEEEQCGKQY